MRRSGDDALGGAPHFVQFSHETGLSVQTSSSIDYDVIGFARDRRLQRVEEHGRGIAARLCFDHLGAGALSPNFELLDCGGTESIGGAEQDVLALRAKDLRELADGRRLSCAVDSDYENNFGRAIDLVYWPRVGCVQNAEQFFFQKPLEFFDIFDLLAIRLFAQFSEHFLGSGGSQIGADQRGFQVVEGVAVDLFGEGNRFFDALGKVFTSARDRLLHAV